MINKPLIEDVKRDLKNALESGTLNMQGQLMVINDALKWLRTMNNEKINETIEKYHKMQKEQQDILIAAQNKIVENAKNIYNHLISEL